MSRNLRLDDKMEEYFDSKLCTVYNEFRCVYKSGMNTVRTSNSIVFRTVGNVGLDQQGTDCCIFG